MSRWKQANWDKWTLGRKVRHVIAVILSLTAVIAMTAVTAYVVLVGFILNAILLDFMHWLF